MLTSAQVKAEAAQRAADLGREAGELMAMTTTAPPEMADTLAGRAVDAAQQAARWGLLLMAEKALDRRRARYYIHS